MRVILVDDVPLSLAHMESLFNEIDDMHLIGTYSNPLQAMEAIIKDVPDVVFLDIEMPELNGLQMAERIKNVHPNILIVFVTAYGNYAIQAFEINVVDYLLKPIKRERMAKTVRRLAAYRQQRATSVQSPMICCFSNVRFLGHGSVNLDVRWRTNKAKELFLFLLQRRNRPVRKDLIIDILWPDTEWEKANNQMYTTVYQIRKMIESIRFPIQIISREESYILNLNGVVTDVDQWENGVSRYPEVTRETLPYHLWLMQLYQGEYLADKQYAWAEAERMRLTKLWIGHASKIANYYIDQGDYHEAIEIYQRMQQFYPYVEDSYFMMMKLYDRLSDQYHVETQYRLLSNMLRDQFNLSPREEVRDWYESWKKNASAMST